MNDDKKSELTLLLSMYSERELIIQNEIRKLILEESNPEDVAIFLILKINMRKLEIKCDINFTIPIGYPDSKITSFLSINSRESNLSSKKVEKDYRKWLNDEILEGQLNQILEAVEKVKELIEYHYQEEPSRVVLRPEKEVRRYYILSHHIYSSLKISNIIKLSREKKLRGLMIVGKPGIIILEGELNMIKEAWSEIRSWNWQRLNVLEDVQIMKYNEGFPDPEFKVHPGSANRLEILKKFAIPDQIISMYFDFYKN